MSREFAFTNQHYTFHPQQIANRFQEDWQLRSQGKREGESDLMVFNGEQPVRDIYGAGESGSRGQLGFGAQKVAKSPSQKAFPIIYNQYNDGSQPHNKTQTFGLIQTAKNPIRYTANEIDPFLENAHSNISQKEQSWQPQRREQQYHANEALTFQHIPAQSQPQTAKFLHIPEKLPNESYFNYSQTEQYRPPQQFIETRQVIQQPAYHFNPPQPSVSHSRSNSRIQVTSPSAASVTSVASPKIIVQEQAQLQPQRFLPSVHQQKRFVQIPQHQYQRLLQNQQKFYRIQQQHSSLKNRSDDLSQKERFYWQQNMTLRQQNKRLRDLVSHFQKRQKQLLSQRQQQSSIFQQQIVKYRDSTLQQFQLLLQRYKLQLQKKK